MKRYLVSTLISMAPLICVASELPTAETLNNTSQVRLSFTPTKNYPPDEKISVVLKNCSISDFGATLANLTQREILVSYRVKHTVIPDIVIDDYPNIVQETILARIKAADVRVAELYPYTLVFFECPAGFLDRTFELR